MLFVFSESDWILFLGRFHPLFVHLPIGAVLLAFVIEVLFRKKHFYSRQSVYLLLVMGFVFGLISAITGYFLSTEGGYGEIAISNHQWAGILFSVLLLSVLIFRNTKLYKPLFIITVICLFITGHLGGNLTHGDAYLTSHMPDEMKTLFGVETDEYVLEPVSSDEALLYEHIVYPILHKKCVSCHNANKKKGELDMRNFSNLLKGGEGGIVLISGNAEESEMIIRIKLDPHHEETMPPDGKERITDEELKIITYWINHDMKTNTLIDSLQMEDDLRAEIEFRIPVKKEINPVFLKGIKEAKKRSVQILEDEGFNVVPIEVNSPFLQVAYLDRVQPISEDAKKALVEISEQLVWLDISGAKNNTNDWSFLLKLKNLTHLDVSDTAVDNEVIKNLNKHLFLEMISLFQTNVTAESVYPLITSTQLKKLYIGNTKMEQQDTIGWSSKKTPELNIYF